MYVIKVGFQGSPRPTSPSWQPPCGTTLNLSGVFLGINPVKFTLGQSIWLSMSVFKLYLFNISLKY